MKNKFSRIRELENYGRMERLDKGGHNQKDKGGKNFFLVLFV